MPQPWGDTLSRRRIGFVIAAVMLGMLLSALDQTVVGTAMPRIIASLDGLQHYAWVATGYLLASTASMPIWGKLSDAYGRKRYFIIGMAIFVTGSVLCGQSHSMTELILFRAFQGLGAGAMMPISQAIIGDIFPPAQRAKWTGVLMSVFAVATIIGPLIGGWITDSSLGWRWTFYVNVPVGIVALTFAAFALPAHVSLRKHRIDYVGSTLLVAAAVPLLLGLSWGGSTYPWSSWQIVTIFAFSAVMWVAFFLRERRAAEPVINPNLFQNSVFTVSAVAGALQMAAMFGAIMFLPLFVQGVLGKSATNSGIILMPLMLGAIVTSIGAGQIIARTGKYKVIVIVGVRAVGVRRLPAVAHGRRHHVDDRRARHGRSWVSAGRRHERLHGDRAEPVPVASARRSHRRPAVLPFDRQHRRAGGVRHHPEQPVRRRHEDQPAGAAAEVQRLGGARQSAGAALAGGEREDPHACSRSSAPRASSCYQAFMHAVRQSLSTAISDLFLISAIVGLIGLVVVLFLREDPLRRTHAIDPESGEEDSEAGPAAAQPVPTAEAQAEPAA